MNLESAEAAGQHCEEKRREGAHQLIALQIVNPDAAVRLDPHLKTAGLR